MGSREAELPEPIKYLSMNVGRVSIVWTIPGNNYIRVWRNRLSEIVPIQITSSSGGHYGIARLS
jgi:hypothetical protein